MMVLSVELRILVTITNTIIVCLSSVVVKVLDLRLEIPTTTLLSTSMSKSFTHVASVTKRHHLVPA